MGGVGPGYRQQPDSFWWAHFVKTSNGCPRPAQMPLWVWTASVPHNRTLPQLLQSSPYNGTLLLNRWGRGLQWAGQGMGCVSLAKVRVPDCHWCAACVSVHSGCHCHYRSEPPLCLIAKFSPQPWRPSPQCGAASWRKQGRGTCQGSWGKPASDWCSFSPPCFRSKKAYTYSSQEGSRLPTALLLVSLSLQPSAISFPVSDPRAGAPKIWLKSLIPQGGSPLLSPLPEAQVQPDCLSTWSWILLTALVVQESFCYSPVKFSSNIFSPIENTWYFWCVYGGGEFCILVLYHLNLLFRFCNS